MKEYALGAYTLRVNSKTRVDKIKPGAEEGIPLSVWLNSCGVIIWETCRKDEYYITLPLYSATSLFVRDKIISDSLSDIIDGAEISKESLDSLLDFCFLCSPKTLFKDVLKLPRWTYMKISEDGAVSLHPIKLRGNDGSSAREGFGVAMSTLRLRGTREGGKTALAFSGGLDSALLREMLKRGGIPHSLYNVRVIGGRDESAYQKICLGDSGDSVERSVMTEEDAEAAFLEHIKGYELFSSSIALKYEFMYKDLAKRGYRTVLTGDGPDELFVSAVSDSGLITDNGRRMRAILGGGTGDVPCFFKNEGVLGNWYAYNYVFSPETNVYFEHLIAARYGIDLVMPYLSPEMLDFSARHSEEIYGMRPKELLRDYAIEMLPEVIVQREKRGFTSDVALWFSEGRVFYERAKALAAARYPTDYENSLAARIGALLSEYSGNYDPESRTKGRGGINSLYANVLVLSWLVGIRENNIHGLRFE